MSIAPANAARLSFDRPDRLAKSLKVAGMTSNEMADYLGLSRTTISNYINGRTEPNRSQVRDWALRTGVPLEWLEDGTLPRDGGDSGPESGTLDYGSVIPGPWVSEADSSIKAA